MMIGRLVMTAALASSALLSGCAMGSPANERQVEAPPANYRGDSNQAGFYLQDMAGNAAPASRTVNAEPSLVSDEKITRTGWVEIDVGEELEYSNVLRAAADRYGATVMSFSDSMVVFRMPASNLEALINDFMASEQIDLDAFDLRAYDGTGKFMSAGERLKIEELREQILRAELDNNPSLSFDEKLKIIDDLTATLHRKEDYLGTQREIERLAGRVELTIRIE